MQTRCKFKLNTVTERIGSRAVYGNPDEPKKVTNYEECSLWDAEFNAVQGGTSDDNQKFWTYTPGGKLTLSTINRMPWVIGREYYLDISEVPEA